LLSACNTIEHRKETIIKNPLPLLPQHKMLPRLIWLNSQSRGVGGSDAKLRLAITESEVIVADYRGEILALKRETGNLIWRAQCKKHILAGPFVAEKKIFVGTEDEVLAYRFSDGKLLWQAEVDGAVLATPQANKGIVFAHVIGGSVVALNDEDGRQLWRYNVTMPALILRKSSSPVIAGDTVIVGFSNGKLVALHRMDGTPEWEREIAVSKGRSDIQNMVDIVADPVVKDDIVYVVSYQGKAAALELATGALIWERELSSYSGLAVGEQSVFVSDTSGVVWALSRKTGEVLWKQEGLMGRRLTAPAVLNDFVVVGDEDGHLHWLSEKSGNFEGRVLVDSKGLEATPIVRNNVVYVLGRGGKVAAYTLPT
jgi:outer membrane protein assembly factor BamB